MRVVVAFVLVAVVLGHRQKQVLGHVVADEDELGLRAARQADELLAERVVQLESAGEEEIGADHLAGVRRGRVVVVGAGAGQEAEDVGLVAGDV